jgi:hypothetical protein
MPDYTKRWIELRRREQHMNGNWSCHYVIFEFGAKSGDARKGAPTAFLEPLKRPKPPR